MKTETEIKAEIIELLKADINLADEAISRELTLPVERIEQLEQEGRVKEMF